MSRAMIIIIAKEAVISIATIAIITTNFTSQV